MSWILDLPIPLLFHDGLEYSGIPALLNAFLKNWAAPRSLTCVFLLMKTRLLPRYVLGGTGFAAVC